MKQLLSALIIICAFSCSQNAAKEKSLSAEKPDAIFQYSVFAGLTNKIYEGVLTVGELKKHGDTGLGTYNGLNGEMIVSGGEVYQLLENGTIRKPEDSEQVPFAVVSFFETDKETQIKDETNYEGLKKHIRENLPSENIPYTFQINGSFEFIQCSGAAQQEKPYQKTLSEALADKPVYDAGNITGTMVGFWFPEYVGKINVAGFHLHFISDDKNFAGHVIDFNASSLDIRIDFSDGMNVLLPDTEEFLKSEFDLSQGYN